MTDRGDVFSDLAVMAPDGGRCLLDLVALSSQPTLFGDVALVSTARRALKEPGLKKPAVLATLSRRQAVLGRPLDAFIASLGTPRRPATPNSYGEHATQTRWTV